MKPRVGSNDILCLRSGSRIGREPWWFQEGFYKKHKLVKSWSNRTTWLLWFWVLRKWSRRGYRRSGPTGTHLTQDSLWSQLWSERRCNERLFWLSPCRSGGSHSNSLAWRAGIASVCAVALLAIGYFTTVSIFHDALVFLCAGVSETWCAQCLCLQGKNPNAGAPHIALAQVSLPCLLLCPACICAARY